MSVCVGKPFSGLPRVVVVFFNSLRFCMKPQEKYMVLQSVDSCFKTKSLTVHVSSWNSDDVDVNRFMGECIICWQFDSVTTISINSWPVYISSSEIKVFITNFRDLQRCRRKSACLMNVNCVMFCLAVFTPAINNQYSLRRSTMT